MNIEPGKFYKTRAGEKARIYSDDNGECAVTRFHGAIYSVGARLWVQRGWYELGRIKRDGAIDEDDIIAEWTEPHPLANAKPGDPIWVRGYSEVWFFTRFKELREGDEKPVIVSNRADMSMPCAWSEGKPYVTGEKP